MELTAPPPAKTSKKNDEKKKMLQAKVKLINVFYLLYVTPLNYGFNKP